MSADTTDKTVSFQRVLSAEWNHINTRRRAQGRTPLRSGSADAKNRVTGLALSGGGIRAAALSIGAIHALSSENNLGRSVDQPDQSLFEKIDYISSVSGGSYAACSIVAKMIQDGIEAPLSNTRDPNVLQYLWSVRKNSKLLNDYIEILLNWLYGVASAVITILPFLLALAAVQIALFQDDAKLQSLISSYEDYFLYVIWIGVIAYLSFAIVLSVSPGLLSYVAEVWRVIAAAGIFLIFVGLQPIVIRANLPGGDIRSFFESHAILREIEVLGLQEIAIPLGLFIAAASLLMVLFLRRERFLRKANSAQRLGVYQVGIQLCLLALLIIGPVFLWSIVLMFSRWGVVCGACSLSTEHHHSPQSVFAAAQDLNNLLMPLYRHLGLDQKFSEVALILPALAYSVLYLIVAVSLFVITKYVLDSNSSSFHRYYRDCIGNCFFLHLPSLTSEGAVPVSSRVPQITQLNGSTNPYLLVNCTLNAGKRIAGKKLRADEPFVVGSCYTGNEFSGFVDTKAVEQAIGSDFDLATIAAISGAAFSPVMGKYTIASFRLLMSVLALRLGYWIPNPRRLNAEEGGNGRLFLDRLVAPGRRVDGVYLLREMFGLLGAGSRFLYITDGGHTDNSGVFELLRRRCSTIIAIDSEADSERLFDNIVYVIELARSRFNIDITMSCRTVGIEGGTHCAIAEITYPPYEGLPGASGRLLYCKLSLTGDENLDLLSRKRATGEFPYHSTLNQNYDELLFNAYRILGSHIVGRVVSGQDRVEFSNGELRSLTATEVQNLFS
jgi:hypothetical protein